MHDWDVTKNSYASPSTFCLKLAVLRRHNVLPSFHRIKVYGGEKNLSINEIRMSTINISLRGVLSTFNSFQQLWWDGSNVLTVRYIYPQYISSMSLMPSISSISAMSSISSISSMSSISPIIWIIAKVCFAHWSTSRLALGSPGCSFVRRRHHDQHTTLRCFRPYKP